jgi:hypothetical protein
MKLALIVVDPDDNTQTQFSRHKTKAANNSFGIVK